MKFNLLCILAMEMCFLQNVFAVELVTPDEARSSQQAAMLEAELTAKEVIDLQKRASEWNLKFLK